MNNLVYLTIYIIHLTVLIFVIVSPFTNSNYLLFMHSILVPFIMLHWLLNNDSCAVTMMEKYARGGGNIENIKNIDNDDCISYKIVGPIYNLTKDYADHSKLTWIITISLWLISVSKLYIKYKNGEIKNIKDLNKF